MLNFSNKEHNWKTSIFIGNLPFAVSEEQVYEKFSDCGEIVNVRIVRDKSTNVGKGFGYVEFKVCPVD
jgi:nucleolar protein 12